jgi:hypothetical protein
LIGEEIDFVERDTHNSTGIHHLFTQLIQDGLPMVQRIQAIGQMIRQKLKQYGQPIPLEYAITVVTRPAARPALGIPTMYHRPQAKKQSFTSTGTAERAAETPARLRGVRGQGVKGPRKQILSPMPSILEEPAQRSVDTSVVDDDGDSSMDAIEDKPVQPSDQPSAQPSVVDDEGDSNMGDEEDGEEDSEEDGEEDDDEERDEEGEEEGGWVPPKSEPTSEEE